MKPKKHRSLRNFRDNRSGIVLIGLICIVFIVTSSLIGLVGALAVNRIADALSPFTSGDIRATALVETARNAYILSIVLVDITLLVYWAVSAQRKESQEQPASGVIF